MTNKANLAIKPKDFSRRAKERKAVRQVFLATEIATAQTAALGNRRPRGWLAPLHRTRWRSGWRLAELMGVSLALPYRLTSHADLGVTP